MKFALCLLCASLVVAAAGESPQPATPSQSAAVVVPGYPSGTVTNITATEFEKLWKERKYTVLDVRTPFEFKSGHIPGAINIDIYGKDFASRVAKLNTNQAYLVYCRSGARSARAATQMRQMKFPYLFNLQGGISSWEKEGKPLEH